MTAEIIPHVVQLEAGTRYRLCQCFKCGSAPSADDNCRRPLEFTVQHQSQVWLCSCGRSKNLPYCDSSHSPRHNMSFWQICKALKEDFRDWWQRRR